MPSSKSRKRRNPYGNWGKVAPKRTSTRRGMLSKFGRRCFLKPEGTAKNSHRPMFPICDSRGKLNCGGVQAAYTRARQWKYNTVAAKASRIGHSKCGWGQRKSRRKSTRRRKSTKPKRRRKSMKKSRRKSTKPKRRKSRRKTTRRRKSKKKSTRRRKSTKPKRRKSTKPKRRKSTRRKKSKSTKPRRKRR